VTGRLEIRDDELHGFIDGELTSVRAAEIAKLIAGDALLGARVAALRSDKDKLTRIYGKIGEHPLPPEWLSLIERRAIQRPRFFPLHIAMRRATALAAGVVLILGVWLTYQQIGSQREDVIVAEAFAARSETMPAQQSFAATAFATPEMADQVLTTALGMMLKAPDLNRMGYSLATVRTYSDVPGGSSVELDYRNAENRLFTLYLRRPSGPARIELLERAGTRICIWQDDVLGTVMLGEMSAGEMARLASLAYAGLTS